MRIYLRSGQILCLLRILEVQGSNIGPETGYSDSVCCGFPQFKKIQGWLLKVEHDRFLQHLL
jgi:hypothetical protein